MTIEHKDLCSLYGEEKEIQDIMINRPNTKFEKIKLMLRAKETQNIFISQSSNDK